MASLFCHSHPKSNRLFTFSTFSALSLISLLNTFSWLEFSFIKLTTKCSLLPSNIHVCRLGLSSSNQKRRRAQAAQPAHQHYLTGQIVHHSPQYHCGVVDRRDWKGRFLTRDSWTASSHNHNRFDKWWSHLSSKMTKHLLIKASQL